MIGDLKNSGTFNDKYTMTLHSADNISLISIFKSLGPTIGRGVYRANSISVDNLLRIS